jgi:acyl-CoA thioester hydrolase
MPEKFQRQFRVRHYECDLNGELKCSAYLRYMQETAFDASAAVGYDLPRYRQIQRSWLIRRTDIEYFLPVGYGDSVIVTTWVADFHRVRSIRAYELHLASSGALAAQAFTDWVFIDTARQRPASIPPEVIDAFHVDPDPRLEALRRPFPVLPEPDGRMYTFRRPVEWRDLDPGQHVNNAVYLAYLEDGGRQALSALGWTPDALRTSGYCLGTQRFQIEYRSQARWRDELQLSTWVLPLSESSFERYYVLQRSTEDVVVRGRSLHTWQDAVTRQPVSIPQDLRYLFITRAQDRPHG